MIWQLSKKLYLVIICNPEIGATRYTVHENHQKLSILVLFWPFFKKCGNWSYQMYSSRKSPKIVNFSIILAFFQKIWQTVIW